MADLGNLANEVADALWPRYAARERHARGVVSSVEGRTAQVLLLGSPDPTPCGILSGCDPAPGDIALVLVMPSGCIVLGTIG